MKCFLFLNHFQMFISVNDFPKYDEEFCGIIERSEPWELHCCIINSIARQNALLSIGEGIKLVVLQDFEFVGHITISIEDDDLFVDCPVDAEGIAVIAYEDPEDPRSFNVGEFNGDKLDSWERARVYQLVRDIMSK